MLSDPHGRYQELKEILTYWNPQEQTLVLLGDIVDRGPSSLECLRLIMQLQEKGNVITVDGNHEQLLCEWLEMKGNESFYYLEVFNNTIQSFFPDVSNVLQKYTKQRLANVLRTMYQAELSFIKNMLTYYETVQLLFVHGGYNLEPNWKVDAERDCKWIRQPFISGENKTGKTIIFGHTPTENMHDTQSNDIWISPCKTKIGIDGSCVYGGQLNAIVISHSGKLIDTFSVKKKGYISNI